MNGHFCSWHRVCGGAVEVAGSAGWVVTEGRVFSEQRFVCLTVFGMLGSGGGEPLVVGEDAVANRQVRQAVKSCRCQSRPADVDRAGKEEEP